MQISLFISVSLGQSFIERFAQLIFIYLIRTFSLNPKSRHDVTPATPRVAPVRLAKAFIRRKVDPLARVSIPSKARQLNSTPPRDGFAILIGKRLVEFCKEISLKLLRVLIKRTSRQGRSRFANKIVCEDAHF